MEKSQWWSKGYVIGVVVGLLGICLYLPTISFGFVNLDDPWLIRDNVTLHHWSWSNLQAIWLDLSTAQRLRLGGEFLPVRDMSVLLDFSLFGSWTGGFHLTNVLLYGLLCAGVALFLLTWFQSPLLAWMAGTIYTVHPLHVEAVAWLSERKGLLAGVFFIGSLILFRLFLKKGSWLLWLLATFSLVLAIWSKALAITGVGVLASLLWFFYDSPHKDCSKVKAWLGWGLLSVVAVAAFVPVWIAGQRVNMVQGFHGGSWLETVKLMTKVHGLYWQQLLLASDLGIKYPVFPGGGFSYLSIIGVFAALVLLVFLGLGLWKKQWRLTAFAASCWFIFLAPVSQLIFPLQNIMADRYMLLPSLTFAILLAEGLRVGLQSLPRNLVWGCILLLGVMATVGQTMTWSSTQGMYEQALRVYPNWVTAMMQLAHLEGKKGRYKQAQRWVARAKKINPNHPKVALRSSILLLRQRKVKEATQVLQLAVKASKNDKIRANLALLLKRQGKLNEALRWAKEAVSIRPLIVHNQRVLGVIALQAKQFFVAEEAFKQALHLEPHHPHNWMNMAALRMAQGQKAEGQRLFQQAQQMMRQRRRRR